MTLNYIGSKKKLLPYIEYVILSNIDEKKVNTFGDLFAGTGIVGKHFSKKGFTIIANDTEKYSYVINYASLKSSYTETLQDYINIFNDMKGISGLLHNNYSPKVNRLFFTENNTKKADSIRTKIEELHEEKKIDNNEYNFLLASLIQSLDKVANTTSVYGAFLKKFKKSALKPLFILPIHKEEKIKINNIVLCKNILNIDRKIDVIYLDPPYVSRQYGANYCPLNYLVEYDEKIKLRGKTGLYDYYKSPFASKSNAKDAFKKMFLTLTNICSKIFLSYNDKGILKPNEIINIMKKYGSIKVYTYSYKKYQAVKSRGGNTEEYIYYLHYGNIKTIKYILSFF